MLLVPVLWPWEVWEVIPERLLMMMMMIYVGGYTYWSGVRGWMVLVMWFWICTYLLFQSWQVWISTTRGRVQRVDDAPPPSISHKKWRMHKGRMKDRACRVYAFLVFSGSFAALAAYLFHACFYCRFLAGGVYGRHPHTTASTVLLTVCNNSRRLALSECISVSHVLV